MITTFGEQPKVGTPEYHKDITWFKHLLTIKKDPKVIQAIQNHIKYLEDALVETLPLGPET